MILELNREEHGYLVNLVESRVSELHPEIRRSMKPTYRDDLKHELECCKKLLTRLQELAAEKAPVVA